MDRKDRPEQKKNREKSADAEARAARLKQALRDNLHRRKAQGRARDSDKNPTQDN